MAFYSEKDWYKSKTIWAGLITTLLAVAGIFGFTTDLDANTIVNAAFALLGALGVYGRVTATTAIGSPTTN